MKSWISDVGAPPRPGEELKAALRDQAHALGFQAFGVVRADACPEAGARLRAWLAGGCHGDMLWMESNADRRASPAALWPEVRSVIALGISYAPALDPLRHLEQPNVGVISVYALGQDYHDVLKPRLKSLARWLCAELPGREAKVFVDTAPVMEKPLAAAAGLGWQGKHTNLLSREHGSWLFLAAILTTAELPPDAPETGSCGSCTRCLTACPTDAFPAPYRLDARRCISYLTIEHKGAIPHAFRRAIGNRIYGCDDCLAVCPWNKFAAQSRELAFAPRAELTAPLLADLLTLDDAAFRAAFAGSPIKRIGRDRFVRNVCIAAGNSRDTALIPALSAPSCDPAPVVAEAAQWALAELQP
jgi:epoxyqueuosine reductase